MPSFGFGTDHRRTYETKHVTPGAGSYEIKSKAIEAKGRFHMGIKLNEPSKLNVPGSGSYNPETSATKQSSSAFSMGVKLKGALEPNKFSVPGPGQYTNSAEKLKSAAPQFGFGTSKRPDVTGNKKN